MIGWYVHHQGQGHLTRALTVAERMQTPVTGLSSLPRPEGWVGDWVLLDRDDTTAGGHHADVAAGGVLHWAPLGNEGLAARTSTIAGFVATRRPRLVVVDVSVEVALVCRLAGAPVVVVALPGDRADRPHRSAYDLAAMLLAPWPAETHTGRWPSAWAEKVLPVGAISRFDGRAAPAVDREPGRVLVLWGGGGRSVGADEVDAARRATPGCTWVERSPHHPSPDLWRELHEAEVVVTHGGQNAVADVAASGAPAVVVAQPRPFGEQVATARAVDQLGAAVGLDAWPAAGAWPELLRRARTTGGRRWGAWSSGRGAADAAAALDALASDLPPSLPERG